MDKSYDLEYKQKLNLDLGVINQLLNSLYWSIEGSIIRKTFSSKSYNILVELYNSYAARFDHIVNNNIQKSYFIFPSSGR